jgi:hypothetical protein
MDIDSLSINPTSPWCLKALLCPAALTDSLIKLGQKHTNEIFPRSHKCQFRFNPKTYLTELQIRTNTYARMVKRTVKSEKNTGLILQECLTSFIFGLELAATVPTFIDNYSHIRQGLYNLMICYNDDIEVQKVLASIIQCFPELKPKPEC